MSDAFDFETLDLAATAETPFEFELEHPETKEGLGVFISVIGSESDTFQRYIRAEGNKARAKAFERQRKGKTLEPSKVEEDEDMAIRAVATCIKAWRTVKAGKSEPVIYWGGRKLECDQTNAFDWLKRFRWVRDQVNKATGDINNFLPKASPSSQPSSEASSN